MTRGRKPKPTALKKAAGNPGKRALNHAEPQPPEGLPSCPPHLSDVAKEEWERVAQALHDMGVLSVVDRAGLAAYCQAYGRWVEAEEKLREGPPLIRTPSGHVQQSPWMGIANKQLELMGRYMAEFGMTPASRSRVAANDPRMDVQGPIEIVLVSADGDGGPTPNERAGGKRIAGDRHERRVEIRGDDVDL
ncbi:MAG: phage terminase small subunit P27 family [Pseudomonadota bacterium]